MDFPTRHDWESFFRDAKDMNETLPGERPDTIHLEGLPCRWFSQKDSQLPDRPSEEALISVFKAFGKVPFFYLPFYTLFSIKSWSFSGEVMSIEPDKMRILESKQFVLHIWLHYYQPNPYDQKPNLILFYISLGCR